MITLRNTFIAALLISAIVLSGWSILLSNKSKKVIAENAPNQPDAFMEDINLTVMSKEGKPTLKLDAPKATHFADNDVTDLDAPHVIVYRETTEPWRITANHAKSKEGITEIIFWDNVVIHHLADTDNPLTTIRTSALTILPNQQMAKTAEEITFIQPNTKIQAVGMLANWDKGTVKLLSQAREEYVPHS